MNILQINAVGQTMSTGRNCLEIQEFINKKTDNICYTAFSSGKIDEYSFKISNKCSEKVHALLARLTGKQGYYSRRSTKKLIKLIKGKNIDVVAINNVHANFINFPMLLNFLAKNDIATAIVLHDCWFYTGKCCYYTVQNCFAWQNGCGNCPQLKKDIPSWFRDITHRLWKDKKRLFRAVPRLAVIGVSDWITNEAKRSFLKEATIINRIYNWIDLNKFSPQIDTQELRKKFNCEDKKIILGVASGWNKRKGLYSFIKLSALLNDEYRIVLVGKVPKDIVLPHNVYNLEETDSVEELAQAYSMANVFVTLSMEETFGKVSAEALACGTPVICFDSTANKELVGEGCGKVIASNDLNEVLKAVEEICDLGKERYGKKCREFAEKNFGKEDRIRDYLRVFEELAQSKA